MKYLIFGKYSENAPYVRLCAIAETEDELTRIRQELESFGMIVSTETEEEYFKGCKDFEEKLYKALTALHIYSDNMDCGSMLVSFDVSGDWKHDHIHCDSVMRKLFNLKPLSEKTIDSDGSDAYTSIHYYVKTLAS